jgi:predicted amidophosphoribosyltransferase
MHARLERELQTIQAMITIYCGDRHGATESLCADCQALLAYAQVRLDRCHFGAEKPTCVNCPVHCYQPRYREQVRTVMRYAGPRMLWRHPVLSVRHWLDGLRQRAGRS